MPDIGVVFHTLMLQASGPGTPDPAETSSKKGEAYLADMTGRAPAKKDREDARPRNM